MRNSEQILKIASREIGYLETPANSNQTKYGKWFGLDGVSWCAIFISWCYAKAGNPIKGFGFANGFAGTQTMHHLAAKKGLIVTDPIPGDIVLFDFNNDMRVDHCGIFEKNLRPGYFNCIEGNTSITNNSNGGAVMRRQRPYKKAIFVRLKF